VNACLTLACVVAAAIAAPGGGSKAHLAVRIAAPPAVIADFSDRLGPRLAGRGVGLEVTSVAEVDFAQLVASPADTTEDAPLARVWVDGRGPDRALLFLKPQQGDRVLVRKIELAGGFDQVALAQIAYIIETAVTSLLVSEPVGVPQSEARAAVEAVLPVARPAVETPAGSRYRAGVFGGVGAWSGDAVAVARIGIEGAMERTAGTHWLGVAASVVADPSFHVGPAGGDLLVRSLAVHLYATATWRGGLYGAGAVAVGPALVVTHVEASLTSSSSGETVSQAPRTDLDFGLGATARWELPLGRRTSVFLAALLDLVPTRARYVATVRGEDRILFSPWALRPGLVLGVATGSELR
jgi:hypothetical protein